MGVDLSLLSCQRMKKKSDDFNELLSSLIYFACRRYAGVSMITARRREEIYSEMVVKIYDGISSEPDYCS